MAFYLRAPKNTPHVRYDNGRFTRETVVVMHDACARAEGVYPDASLQERFAARDAFAARAGDGYVLCWVRIWSQNAQTAPECFFCGRKVVGHG